MKRTTKLLVVTVAAVVAVCAVVAIMLVPSAPTAESPAPATDEPPGSPLPAQPGPSELPPAQSLASPESALEAQVRAILGGHLTAFRLTLLPEAASDLTPEVWRGCVARIHQQPVNATWSDSPDERTDAGELVRGATVLGGVHVGFHERRGHWFADRIWCAP